jgi:oligopeptide/dipeptide ABC transporter ATP-binding protein
LLLIDRLSVCFEHPRGRAPVLRDVSFAVERGEILALVGESGSGKTLTALAILGLLPAGAEVTAGEIVLDGSGDLLRLREPQLRRVRGRRVAMVFQDPMGALNPVLTIGFQIAESLRVHRGLGRRAARDEARRLLELVAMPDPGLRLGSYPHQLSGGQLQRAMIAVALASDPDLLLADEPTTALDVTIQAQVLELLAELRRRLGLTVVLITHDLAVVAECSDRVAVMYAGQIVELARVGELFERPAHPYTRGLIASMPRLGGGIVQGMAGGIPEPLDLPDGCTFHPRCPRVFERCRRQAPDLYETSGGARRSRCFLALDEEGSPT